MNRRDRLNHQPFIKRPKLVLKDNKKIILWVIVNLEVWDPELAQPRNILPPPMNVPMLPDLPNWAWHEYGMRVGFWRLLNTLKKRNLCSTLALNATVIDHYPETVEAAMEEKWEPLGHGYIQRPMHKVDNEFVDINSVAIECENIDGCGSWSSDYWGYSGKELAEYLNKNESWVNKELSNTNKIIKNYML